jgi:hypothetical protein
MLPLENIKQHQSIHFLTNLVILLGALLEKSLREGVSSRSGLTEPLLNSISYNAGSELEDDVEGWNCGGGCRVRRSMCSDKLGGRQMRRRCQFYGRRRYYMIITGSEIIGVTGSNYWAVFSFFFTEDNRLLQAVRCIEESMALDWSDVLFLSDYDR